MPKSQKTESFFEFVPRRHEEITSRIDALKRELEHLESELAILDPHMSSIVERKDSEADNLQRSSSVDSSSGTSAPPTGTRGSTRGKDLKDSSEDVSASIKDQALTILLETESVWTNAELIAEFASRFNRQVPGSSLSPQLNRLARDGVIEKRTDGWARKASGTKPPANDVPGS